jgi:hypothetical protein
MSEIENQLLTYCNMNPSQADALMKLYLGEQIHQNQFEAFVGSGLIMRRNNPNDKQAHMINQAGWFALTRIKAIRGMTYAPEQPHFTTDELIALTKNPGAMARMSRPKGQGLRSAHMKALTAVARHPGLMKGTLLRNFSFDIVNHLDNRLLIELVGGDVPLASKYSPRRLSTQGLSMLNWCLNQIKLDGEDKWEKP